jgi:glycosyltransferase involved in cell wall biosynthesis
LEALAHGQRVLASAATALPEVLAGHGELLPTDDATAWAAAIASPGATDPEVRAARRAHAATFGWAKAAAGMLQVWRTLAASNPRAAASD